MSKAGLKAPLISATGSSTASADPFHVIRENLESEIRKLRTQYEGWVDLVRSCNTASDITFQIKDKEFKTALDKTTDVCKKLRAAVTQAEKDRIKFSHIDDAELAIRKSAVQKLEKDLAVVKDGSNSKDIKSKLEGDQKRELASRAATERADAIQGYNSYTAANADYLRDQTSVQAQIRKEQDVAVDSLSGSLSRVKELAVAIDNEVREQDALLTDVDKEVDTAQSKMDSAIKQVEKLLKTKDKCQLWTIILLVVAFIIVAIVAFYVLTKT